MLLAERHDVGHHQEITGEAEPLDEVELVANLRPSARHPLGLRRAVPIQRTTGGEMPQVRHLVMTVGTGVRRQVGCDQRQVECAVAAELRSSAHHTRPAGEPAGLLGTGSHVCCSCWRQPAVQIVEAAPGAHSGHGSGQSPPRGGGVVDTVGADRLDAGPHRQRSQRVVALAVERVAVVPQLDEDVVTADGFNEAAELGGCGARPAIVAL